MIEVLETIVSVVKHLAVGAGSGLAGLQSMHAAGEFLGGWPAGALPAGTQYYALASDFEPAGGALVSLRDRVTDAVFGDAGNDLVVPTAGVYEAGGAGFPITERHVFARNEHVPHSGFFANGDARARLLGWLASGV